MARESFTREERALVEKARELSYGDYEMRRSFFKQALRTMYPYRTDYHVARVIYSIGSNLVLDESDIIDFVTEIWGISEDRFYGLIW